MPRNGVLDIEQRTDGLADLLAVAEAYTVRVVDEQPHDAASSPEFYLEVRELVPQPFHGRFQQFRQFVSRHVAFR